MAQAQGIVSKIFDKVVGNGKTIYSFRLEDDKNYYRTGFDKPNFRAGNEVKFEYNETKYGKEVVMASVRAREGQAPTDYTGAKVEPNKGSYQKKSGNARDQYWEEKDRYDKEVRQPLISYQAATNVAKDLVIAALNGGILPVTGKKADKYENFMAMVKEVRDEVYADYHTAAARLEAGKPIVETSEEAPTATIEEEQTPVITEESVPGEDDWGSLEDKEDWS